MNSSEQNMQIFTIIGHIEDLVENSPRPKLGGQAKRVVDVAEIMDLLGDLKVTIPEDIRRANSVLIEAQTMVDNAGDHARELVEEAQQKSDSTISQANETSERIITKAKNEYERLVSEDEIYQEAQRRSKLLALKAEHNARLVYENARVYADEVLKDLESFLAEYKQLVAVNREDLKAQAMKVDQSIEGAQYAQQQANEPANEPVQQPVQPMRPQMQRQVAQQPPEQQDGFDDEFDDDEKPGSFFDLFKRRKKKDVDFDDDEHI